MVGIFRQWCIKITIRKTKKNKELHYGDVKAARLHGDPACSNLIAFSVYDAKPVYFLSMACEKVRWDKNTRNVYDKTKRQKVPVNYYRSNIQNFYNYHMNSVDIADQLRQSYGFQHWVRNRKWWWALFMWAFGMMLVNSYLLYKTAHLIIWCTEKKNIMSHYEFRKSIALVWLQHKNANAPTSTVPETSTVASSTSTTSSSRKRRSTTIKIEDEPKQKCRRVTDNSLNPMTGSLKMWLDGSPHLPIVDVNKLNKKTFRCQLH